MRDPRWDRTGRAGPPLPPRLRPPGPAAAAVPPRACPVTEGHPDRGPPCRGASTDSAAGQGLVPPPEASPRPRLHTPAAAGAEGLRRLPTGRNRARGGAWGVVPAVGSRTPPRRGGGGPAPAGRGVRSPKALLRLRGCRCGFRSELRVVVTGDLPVRRVPGGG